MFLNPKELKRMMKEAFKASNLVVGNTGEAYYLQGTNWKVLCKKVLLQKRYLQKLLNWREKFRKKENASVLVKMETRCR